MADLIDQWGAAAKAGIAEVTEGELALLTESRREALNFATAFGQNRPRVGIGIALAQQLDLFSEPTESSDQLRENAERRVAFHTADLSPQERQVIEGAPDECIAGRSTFHERRQREPVVGCRRKVLG